MTAPVLQKYAFDTVFDEAGAVAFQPLRAKRSYTPEEVEDIRRDAYAAGEQSAQGEIARAVGEIAVAAEGALGALARVAHDHRTASAELALVAARKIADSALERFPEAPVAAAMTELAREIEAQPKLMVRVAPHLIEPVQTALAAAAQAIGFGGQIIAHADPSLPNAAFLLDWGEGRASFDPQAAAARISAAVDTALAAEGLHAEPLIPVPDTSHEADR